MAETKYLDLSGNLEDDRPSITFKLTWLACCVTAYKTVSINELRRDRPKLRESQSYILIILMWRDTLQLVDQQVSIAATSLSAPRRAFDCIMTKLSGGSWWVTCILNSPISVVLVPIPK